MLGSRRPLILAPSRTSAVATVKHAHALLEALDRSQLLLAVKSGCRYSLNTSAFQHQQHLSTITLAGLESWRRGALDSSTQLWCNREAMPSARSIHPGRRDIATTLRSMRGLQASLAGNQLRGARPLQHISQRYESPRLSPSLCECVQAGTPVRRDAEREPELLSP